VSAVILADYTFFYFVGKSGISRHDRPTLDVSQTVLPWLPLLLFSVRYSPRQKKQISIEHMLYTTHLNPSAEGCANVLNHNIK
jgi:hypothetical protein